MNSHEQSIAYMSAGQMGPEEYSRIKKLIAQMKRVADIRMLLPLASQEMESDPDDFLKRHRLKLNSDEILYAFAASCEKRRNEDMRSPDVLARIPESYFRYNQFIANKVALRDYLQKKGCVPADRRMLKWRDRQINRCYGSIGGMNRAFIHAPLCIELADGCSVGCEFCGLGAGRLKSIYRYTPDHAALFRDSLKAVKRVIGQGAGFGMMYFASEALDNPDYEKFEADYYDIFGIIPQITTAVPDRDIERTRRLVRKLDVKKGLMHRFSLRSLDMARKILDEFTPEELLNVELLPQFEEAPGFVPYTVVGAEAAKKELSDIQDSGTICCIDGFCISFAKMTVKVFTPCHMDEANPNGIAIADERPFTDAEDLERLLNWMIEEYMAGEIPKDEALALYDYFHLVDTSKGRALKSAYGGEEILMSTLPAGGEQIISLLMKGDYNRTELAEIAYRESNVSFEITYWLLDQLWDKGFIREKKFFN